jgi:fucose 4-O-acetylase-like acetyltransferase
MTTTTVRALAEATPDTRDRFVDALRAAAIVVVVVGHWLIAVVTFERGQVGATNALAVVPALQWFTWAFQVMPLFFVVGGFANRAALVAAERRGAADHRTYRAGRVARLTAPVAPLAVAWLVAVPLLAAAGVDRRTVDLLTSVVAQPLWFLAVYLLVSAAAPIALAAHRRYGVKVLAALGLAALVGDMTRLPYANYGFVFLAIHQLGFFLGDGTLLRWSRGQYAALAGAGGAALVVLTALGPYPRSMVGVPGERLSNMSPPTICILALAALQLGLVLLVRPAVNRWLQRPRPWTAVIAVNAQIMTIFLWHLTALAIAAAVLLPLGFPQPAPGSASWWLSRLPWIAALTAMLALLVAVAGRNERRALRSPAGGGSTIVAAAAMTILARHGLHGWPAIAAAAATIAGPRLTRER